MADLGDAGEGARYLLGFWKFVFRPQFRVRRMQQWRAADPGMRLILALEAAGATLIGLGLPLLGVWLAYQAMTG